MNDELDTEALVAAARQDEEVARMNAALEVAHERNVALNVEVRLRDAQIARLREQLAAVTPNSDEEQS